MSWTNLAQSRKEIKKKKISIFPQKQKSLKNFIFYLKIEIFIFLCSIKNRKTIYIYIKTEISKILLYLPKN